VGLLKGMKGGREFWFVLTTENFIWFKDDQVRLSAVVYYITLHYIRVI